MRPASFAQTLVAAFVLAGASCANLKFWDRGDSVADEPAPAVAAAPASSDEKSEQAQAKPAPSRIVDDGLRLPDDMLSLPSERELRRPAPEIATDGINAHPPAER